MFYKTKLENEELKTYTWDRLFYITEYSSANLGAKYRLSCHILDCDVYRSRKAQLLFGNHQAQSLILAQHLSREVM